MEATPVEPTEDTSTKTEEPKPPPPVEEKDPVIPFDCSICKLIRVNCEYYGKKPPFARKLQITEDSYVMKDPFCPPPTSGRPNPEYFLVVGVNCAVCESPVCSECSFHFSKTFCKKCALENIKQFPLEIQTKVRKQLQLNKCTS